MFRDEIAAKREQAIRYKDGCRPRSREHDYWMGKEEAFLIALNLIDHDVLVALDGARNAPPSESDIPFPAGVGDYFFHMDRTHPKGNVATIKVAGLNDAQYERLQNFVRDMVRKP